MSELTIAALQHRQPNVTLYVIEADKHYYAFLGDANLNEDRLHDLFLEGTECWKQYFESAWYPLAHGATAAEANDALIAKIRSVKIEDIDKYNRVLFIHSYTIYDNFKLSLSESLDDAFEDLERWHRKVDE